MTIEELDPKSVLTFSRDRLRTAARLLSVKNYSKYTKFELQGKVLSILAEKEKGEGPLDPEVQEILNSQDSKKEKISKLRRLGLTKKQVIDLKFCHFTHVYDFY